MNPDDSFSLVPDAPPICRRCEKRSPDVKDRRLRSFVTTEVWEETCCLACYERERNVATTSLRYWTEQACARQDRDEQRIYRAVLDGKASLPLDAYRIPREQAPAWFNDVKPSVLERPVPSGRKRRAASTSPLAASCSRCTALQAEIDELKIKLAACELSTAPLRPTALVAPWSTDRTWAGAQE